MDGVYGWVDGGIQLLFRAEPRLFQRLAANMLGAPARDAEEVQEFATEFFNTLCGRFISELYRVAKGPARFHPTRYETYPNVTPLGEDTVVLSYSSEEQETAEFSWTADSVAMLLEGRKQ